MVTSKGNLFLRLIPVIFIIIFLFCIAYTYYKAEIHYQGSKEYLNIYYYIFSGGLVFWSIVLLLKHEIRIKISLISISILLTLYVLEFFLYIYKFEPTLFKTIKTAKEFGIEFDKRDKLKVYYDLKKTNSDVGFVVFVQNFIHDNELELDNGKKIVPLSTVANKNIVFCNESGKWVQYKSDRFGFHNPDEIWEEKDLDWIIIGDSFAHGNCVSSKKNVAGRIRSLTNDAVLNLGHVGNGPLTELATLNEYGKFKKPNKVIWMYYEENDMIDLEVEANSSTLTKYLDPEFSQNLVKKSMLVDNALNNYLNKKIENHKKHDFFQILRLHKIRKTTFETPKRTQNIFVEEKSEKEIKQLLDTFSRVMLQAKETVESFNGNLYFVYLPTYQRYSLKSDNYDDLYFRNKTLKIIRNLSIPIIDVHEEVFKKHTDPLSLFPFRLYGHYTTEGYDLIANTIVKKIYEFENK